MSTMTATPSTSASTSPVTPGTSADAAQSTSSSGTTTRRQTVARRLRRWGAVLVLAVGVLFSGTAILAPVAAEAATFGNVFVVSTASYDCGAHTITVWPMTNEPLNGQYSVYSYAQVYDRVSGRWITTGWLLDNGIQGHVFYNMRSFDPYAKVTYARYMYGGWVYKSDWVKINPTLDSSGVFCNP